MTYLVGEWQMTAGGNERRVVTDVKRRRVVVSGKRGRVVLNG
jgi:hypothetical protein